MTTTLTEPASHTEHDRAHLDVDLTAVAANTRLLAHRTPALMAVVKSDGFGHGAAAVARTALKAGATWLGVTSLDEALALRADRLSAPMLSWLNPVDADWAGAIRQTVDVAVPSEAHLAAVVRGAAAAGAGARVHLHLDCGMARDGAPPTQWARLCHQARAAQRAGSIQVVGLMGHLACADEPDHPANITGRARFGWGVTVARSLGLDPRWRHLAATAAALTNPSAHHTLCRVGAGLVGIDPTGTTRLRPALTLRAPVVAVRDVRAGTSVGYGHTWTAPRDTRLVTLPVGYADGIPRSAAGRAEVTLLGRRCPVVGRISMDQVVVDVGGLAAELGDSAVVWGTGGPSVAQWAAWSGTIEHEIVTGVGPRVRRRMAAAGSPR